MPDRFVLPRPQSDRSDGALHRWLLLQPGHRIGRTRWRVPHLGTLPGRQFLSRWCLGATTVPSALPIISFVFVLYDEFVTQICCFSEWHVRGHHGNFGDRRLPLLHAGLVLRHCWVVGCHRPLPRRNILRFDWIDACQWHCVYDWTFLPSGLGATGCVCCGYLLGRAWAVGVQDLPSFVLLQ